MNYKVTIKSCGFTKKNIELVEDISIFQSVTLPYDLINYIYLFMPKHPLAEIVTTGIINVKNSVIETKKRNLIDFLRINHYQLHKPHSQQNIRDFNEIINSNSILSFWVRIVRDRIKISKVRKYYLYRSETNNTIKRLHLDNIPLMYREVDTWSIEQKIQFQSIRLEGNQLHKLKYLHERHILQDYTREKRRKKVGLKPPFEKSQRDYYKRKGIKNGIMVEHIKRTGYYNSVRILNDCN